MTFPSTVSAASLSSDVASTGETRIDPTSSEGDATRTAEQMPQAVPDSLPRPEELARLHGTRALIVDDDPAFLQFLGTMLERRGIQVTKAEDGSAGWQQLQEQAFDFILSDVQMPKMNGFEFLTAVRGNEHFDLTPFILLTGKPAYAGVQSGVSRGADGYLPKPFSEATLLNTILSCLGRVRRITEQAQSELNQLRGNLLTMLPHELNTPLNGIFGVADLLEMGDASEAELADCSQILRISAERMLRLTTNFVLCAELRLHDSQAQQTTLLYEEEARCATCSVESAALKRARSYERENDLRLQLAQATLSIPCPALLKIVDELLDNAFKFSQPGDAVLLRGMVETQRYTFWLEDHGRTGITPEMFQHRGLFVQFNRQQLEQQGAGLGLYLVERLLCLHGGDLEFLASPVRGITVRFSLPLEASPAAEPSPAASSQPRLDRAL